MEAFYVEPTGTYKEGSMKGIVISSSIDGNNNLRYVVKWNNGGKTTERAMDIRLVTKD